MANLKKGSSGSDVRTLQTLLNNAGYNLKVDGIFGSKTLAAVRDFQSKNKDSSGKALAVDGIAGVNTMWALNNYGKSAASTATPTPAKTFDQMSTSEKVTALEKSSHDLITKKPDALTKLENTKVQQPKELTDLLNNKPGKYETPQEVKDALAQLTNLEGQKPGPYESRYDDQIQGLLDQINNREPFSYDFTKDPMYQQYKDEYTNNARLAMMDTMGDAAGLTGGYGSSYGQTVGQQTYQGQMRQLSTDIVPELWNMSYQVYKDNEQSLYNQLSAFQTQDAAEYQRYADQLDAYYNDLNYFFNKYQYLDESAYQKYVNDLEQWNKDRNYWYGKYRDDVADRQTEMDYLSNQWRADQAAAQSELDYYYGKNQDELALAAAQAAASSGGSGGGSRGGSSKKSSTPTTNDTQNNGNVDTRQAASKTNESFADAVRSTVKSYAKSGKDWKSYLDKQYSSGRITWAERQSIYNAYKDLDKSVYGAF